MKKIIYVLVAAVCSAATCSAEDVVVGTIQEAVKQYNNGDYAGAASNLDYASQLVRLRKSEEMKQFLPEAPTGWKAGETSIHTIGAAVLGGGVTVGREYRKDNSLLSMEVVSDSPVLKSVQMMIKNPMFAGAGEGELVTVKGRRGIIKFNSVKRSGDIYIVVNQGLMITIKGVNVERAELVTLAELVDYGQVTQG